MIAAATGDTASKYVARRETPLYIPENCTQCMECIAACPDTALPNTSQELETVLRTAVMRYVSDFGDRSMMLSKLPEIDSRARVMMNEMVAKKLSTPLPEISRRSPNSSTASRTRARRSSPTSSPRCRWLTPRSTPSSRRRSARSQARAASSRSSSRSLQGLRGLRYRLRRSRCAAHGR
jgi:ferredoxin